MTQASKSNMELWEAVKEPDHTLSDKATKVVPGGAGLTSIDPFTLYAMATRLWGPMGLAYGHADDQVPGLINSGYSVSHIPAYPCWGFEEVETKVEAGEHTTTVKLWYPHPTGKMAYVLGKGCTELPPAGKRAQTDVAKKSYTDACTNAMSKVGFGASVYLGKYNDSKYAVEVKERQQRARMEEDEDVVRVRDKLTTLANELADKQPDAIEAARHIYDTLAGEVREWEKPLQSLVRGHFASVKKAAGW